MGVLDEELKRRGLGLIKLGVDHWEYRSDDPALGAVRLSRNVTRKNGGRHIQVCVWTKVRPRPGVAVMELDRDGNWVEAEHLGWRRFGSLKAARVGILRAELHLVLVRHVCNLLKVKS